MSAPGSFADIPPGQAHVRFVLGSKRRSCLRSCQLSRANSRQKRLEGSIDFQPHSKGWTGGSVDALHGVEGATLAASIWLRGAGGLSLTCEIGPAAIALRACGVALGRLEPRERAVNGLAM
jgi:hypothetical protein